MYSYAGGATMNAIRKAKPSKRLHFGLFPVFKEKHVNAKDLKTWIFLKLNFECDRSLFAQKLHYLGYLEDEASGVLSFAYTATQRILRANNAPESCAKHNTERYRSWNNEYALHLRLSKRIDRENIENVLENEFTGKYVVQQMALKEADVRDQSRNCVLLSDQWKQQRPRDEQLIPFQFPFKVINYTNVELIDYSDCDLRVKVVCKLGILSKHFARDLAQKLKVDEMKVLDVARRKQAAIDESMCLREYEISVDSVNAKIEAMKEKYL